MQQKKTFAILLSLAMIVTIVLGNGTFVSAATTEAITGISYYVDSVNGNDDNDGTKLQSTGRSSEEEQIPLHFFPELNFNLSFFMNV